MVLLSNACTKLASGDRTGHHLIFQIKQTKDENVCSPDEC